jgi:hypothetical protein
MVYPLFFRRACQAADLGFTAPSSNFLLGGNDGEHLLA